MSKTIKYYSGAEFVNLTNIKVILIQKVGKQLWEVSIKNTEFKLNIRECLLIKGTFKTPMCSTVYKVGYFGFGEFKCRDKDGKITAEYSVWANMIKRCYTDYKGNKAQKIYEKIKVCDEWLNFQNFASWYCKNTQIYSYYQVAPKLDKDLFGNNEYSPQNCVILPNIINCSLSEKRATSKLSNGIYLMSNGKFTVRIMKYGFFERLGTFSDLDSARSAYKNSKEDHIHELAKKFKDILDDRTYSSLLNWKHSGEYV